MQKFIKFNIDTTFDDMQIIEKAIFKGDTLTLQIKVFDNSVLADLSNQTVDLILKKFDGTVVEGVQKTISNGIITATLTEQATLSEGIVTGTLQITESSTSHLSTNIFTYIVLPSIADTVLEKSKDEINTLSDLLLTISNNENIINTYTNLINQTWNTTDSIKALADIQSYISTNLTQLDNKNATANSNISALQAENNRADSNIPALKNENDNADVKLDKFRLYDTTNLIQQVQNNAASLSEIEQQLSDIIQVDAVSEFNTDNTGNTDTSVQLQNAINSLVGKDGDVFLPTGTYWISNIVLRHGIRLRAAKNTIFKITDTVHNAITIEDFTVIDGITFYYPNQVMSGVPVVYPSTIKSSPITGCPYSSIKNCNFKNSYFAMELINKSGKVEISDCFGFPLYRGLEIDDCLDIPRITNVHFNENIIGNVYDLSLRKWVYDNGIAFLIRRADAPFLSSCFAIGYLHWLQCDESLTNTGACNMLMATNCMADICKIPLYTPHHQDGLSFCNCVFTSPDGERGIGGAMDISGYSDTYNCDVFFNNCEFRSFNDKIIALATDVSFSNCFFADYNVVEGYNGAISVENDNINIDICNTKIKGGGRANTRGISDVGHTNVSVNLSNVTISSCAGRAIHSDSNLYKCSNLVTSDSIYMNGLVCTIKNGELYASSYPTAGIWQLGDRIYNSNPVVGQPKSWICTVTGSPGTWVSEGNL